MNYKQIISVVVSCIGIFLMIYAIHSMNRISEAKSSVHSIGSRISNSSFGKAVSGEMEKKASQYDVEVRLCLISGIVLMLGGGGAAFYFRKHRRR